MGVECGCRAKRIGEGDILKLRWKGFTGDVLAVERSGHWSRRRWDIMACVRTKQIDGLTADVLYTKRRDRGKGGSYERVIPPFHIAVDKTEWKQYPS